MNKLYTGIAFLVVMGAIGLGVTQYDFSTIEQERTISQHAPTVEFDPANPYSVSGEESELIIENLDRNTKYELLVLKEDGSKKLVGTFTTDKSREVSGDAVFNYNFQDYKNKRTLMKDENGYIHQIRKEDQIIKEFGLRPAPWVIEMNDGGFGNDFNFNHEISRGEALIQTTTNDDVDFIEITLKNDDTGISQQYRYKGGVSKNEVSKVYFEKETNKAIIKVGDKVVGEYDATGYKTMNVRYRNKDDCDYYDCDRGLQDMKVSKVPRMHTDFYDNAYSINFDETVTGYEAELFGVPTKENSQVEKEVGIWFDDNQDGDGKEPFSALRPSLKEVEFYTDSFGYNDGDSNNVDYKGFYMSFHPINYTDTDLDGTVDEFDSCPDQEGTQLDGCEALDGNQTEEVIGGNPPSFTNPSEGITGNFGSSPTSQGIAGGLVLLIIVGAGIYFVKMK